MLKWLFSRRFNLWDAIWLAIGSSIVSKGSIFTGFCIMFLALVASCGGEFLLSRSKRDVE